VGTVFWEVMPRRLIGVPVGHRYVKQDAEASLFSLSSTLKMQSVFESKMFVGFCWTRQLCILEGGT
jgi:hypothetical protein